MKHKLSYLVVHICKDGKQAVFWMPIRHYEQSILEEAKRNTDYKNYKGSEVVTIKICDTKKDAERYTERWNEIYKKWNEYLPFDNNEMEA